MTPYGDINLGQHWNFLSISSLCSCFCTLPKFGLLFFLSLFFYSEIIFISIRCTGIFNRCSLDSFLWAQHDDVIKWKRFPRHCPFVRGIHRSPVHSPHKGQWRGALMFTLICARINGWVNNREAGDIRRHCTHYDVIIMGNALLADGIKPPTEPILPYHHVFMAFTRGQFLRKYTWYQSVRWLWKLHFQKECNTFEGPFN